MIISRRSETVRACGNALEKLTASPSETLHNGSISMPSLPQPQPSDDFRRNVADLYGDRDIPPTASPMPAWRQVVAQVNTELCAKLRLEVPTPRLQKALELVLAHAVTLHHDGSASVLSGKQTYTLAPHCPCPDAKNRAELCKHALAVELHRRALALLDGTAHAPASEAPRAPVAVAPAPTAPAVPTSAAWPVQEAQTSACFRWRVGQAELMYTFRGVTDEEVLTRIREQLPLLQDILEACETRAAERAAAPAQAPQAPQAPAPADMHALIQQAVQQALAVQSNGHATGQVKRQAKSRDQESGWCSLHTVAMDLHDNERGTWYSHLLDNGRYCKGAK
jgi:hypothetical protein